MKGATQHLLETKQQLKRAVAHASEMAAREFNCRTATGVVCAHFQDGRGGRVWTAGWLSNSVKMPPFSPARSCPVKGRDVERGVEPAAPRAGSGADAAGQDG